MSDELPMPGLPERGESTAPSFASTGRHWAKHHPQLALEAEKLWKDDTPISTIASALGASRNTIRAYLEDKGMLNLEHESIKRRGQFAASQMINRVLDDPDSVPNSAVALTAKLMMDTAQIASGGPTQIIEHRHEHSYHIPTPEEIRAFRDAHQTGSAAEKMGHSGPAAEAPKLLGNGLPAIVLDVQAERVPVELGGNEPHI